MQGLIFLVLLPFICAQSMTNRINTPIQEDYSVQPNGILNDTDKHMKNDDVAEEDTEEMEKMQKDMLNILRTPQIIFNFDIHTGEEDSSMEAEEEEEDQSTTVSPLEPSTERAPINLTQNRTLV